MRFRKRQRRFSAIATAVGQRWMTHIEAREAEGLSAVDAWVRRPLDAPEWDAAAMARFRRGFAARVDEFRVPAGAVEELHRHRAAPDRWARFLGRLIACYAAWRAARTRIVERDG